MKRCACCRLPADLNQVHHGRIGDLNVVFGICPRCSQANARLPPGARQKRLNACARLAATDETGSYYTARMPDADAAKLTAHLLVHPDTAEDMTRSIGWG